MHRIVLRPGWLDIIWTPYVTMIGGVPRPRLVNFEHLFDYCYPVNFPRVDPFATSSSRPTFPWSGLPQTRLQRLTLGIAGCDELCHSRILRQPRRPVLRHVSLRLRHPRSHRRARRLHEKPFAPIPRCVQQFFPPRFVTLVPPCVLRSRVDKGFILRRPFPRGRSIFELCRHSFRLPLRLPNRGRSSPFRPPLGFSPSLRGYCLRSGLARLV